MNIQEAITTYAKQLKERSVDAPERVETESMRHDIIRDNPPEPQPYPEPVVIEPIPVRVVEEDDGFFINDVQISTWNLDPANGQQLPYQLIAAMPERTSILIQNRGEGNVFIGTNNSITQNFNSYMLEKTQYIKLRYAGAIYVTVDAAATISLVSEFRTRINPSKRSGTKVGK